MRGMGEHKGSGLALMCEMLAGALTGSGCAGPAERRIANGMLSVYLSLAAFDAEHAFAAEARAYLDFFMSARPARANGEVLIPGQPEQRNRETRLAEGIELPEDAWAEIRAAAQGVGLDEAQIDQAVEG